MKPLQAKNYGSIPHLPMSRMGPADHSCHSGQEAICTIKVRDRHDRIVVQEKLDGSNVGVLRKDGKILAITRAGYLASTSPYAQHHAFDQWVVSHRDRFLHVLLDGERLVGEWLLQSHGTIYDLPHEPFVAFDLMVGRDRMPSDAMGDRLAGLFITPHVLSCGPAISVQDVLDRLGEHGHHGALDAAEGAVWRVERRNTKGLWEVDFLTKYVRPSKVDGRYLSSVSKEPNRMNKFIGDAWLRSFELGSDTKED